MDTNCIRDLYNNKYLKGKDKANLEKAFRYFESLETIEEVLKKAPLGLDHRGIRMSDHARHITPEQGRQLTDCLLQNISTILSCGDFDVLMQIVAKCDIPNYGPLNVYDTALRIGVWHKPSLYPSKVYLAEGAFKGAEALKLGKLVVEKQLTPKITVKYLLPENLPEPLNAMKPYDVENFLCHCRNDLQDCVK